jgi:hypothetical protein
MLYDQTEYKNSRKNDGKCHKGGLRAVFKRRSHIRGVYGAGCLTKIPTEKFAYYVDPEILHWEDRATEWSGRPDTIEIRISIYDSTSEDELASAVLKGKSKWATFGGIIHKIYYRNQLTTTWNLSLLS